MSGEASVIIEDEHGDEIPLDESNPADFGTVGSGAKSSPVELRVRNDGEVDVFFVTLTGILHPNAQVGEEDETVSATRFSKTEDGAFQESITFDRLDVGEVETFWARWDVPVEAPGGARVWAIEAAASVT